MWVRIVQGGGSCVRIVQGGGSCEQSDVRGNWVGSAGAS